MNYVEFKNVHKTYPKADFYSVTDFNLEIKKGEFVVFVGPSGCGKSTTLRMLAGLEEISSGEILIDGKVVNNLHPKDRDIAMVFQNYALYPHMTVAENIGFGLKIAKTDPKIIKEKVEWAANILGLTDYLERKPKNLSGGQRQRVALGRSIVRDPKVFLMDEPLSNLDAKLRATMRNEITKLHREIGATTIYVTHDQIEAMTMADKIVVMKGGIIQQIGTPMDLYSHPINLFVANFIGAPHMNLVNVELSGNVVTLEDGETLAIPEGVIKQLNGREGKLVMGIRPVDTSIDAVEIETFPTQVLTSKIENIEKMGHKNHVFSKIGDKQIIVSLPSKMTSEIGDDITYRLDLNKVHFFDPETELALF